MWVRGKTVAYLGQTTTTMSPWRPASKISRPSDRKLGTETFLKDLRDALKSLNFKKAWCLTRQLAENITECSFVVSATLCYP